MPEVPNGADAKRYHRNVAVEEARGKFGGLDVRTARQEAELFLDGNKLHVVRRYLGGMSIGAISLELGLKQKAVRFYLEEAKEDLAHAHIGLLMAGTALDRANTLYL